MNILLNHHRVIQKRLQNFVVVIQLLATCMYYKLYEEKLVEPYLGDHYYTPSSLIGFIRNSENKTVQYIPKGEKDPVTIYNFNISLGDTIYGLISGNISLLK